MKESLEAVVVDLAGRADLEKALATLSLQELELVTLAYRDGLTHEEIAQVTRQSRKTVGKKLAGLLLLRASVAPSPRGGVGGERAEQNYPLTPTGGIGGVTRG